MVTTTRAQTPFASTLPGRYYYDPAIYAQEQERVFSRLWVCVGRADSIPNAGQYFTADVGRENIVVVRGRDGVIRAFLNVCRHRGARVCTAECGQLANSIQCRYHAWTYGLDGRLIGAPNVLHDQSFDRAQYGLISVAVEIWEGLLWVSLADEPGPLAEQVEPPLRRRFEDWSRFTSYHVGELVVGKSITYDVKANWKLLAENFMECYHCAPMHPELVRLLPGFGRPNGPGGSYGDPGGTRLADDVEAFALSGKGGIPKLRDLHPENDQRYYGMVLYPNVFINFLPNHVILHTVWPLAADRSRVVCDWLFEAETVAQPGFDPSDTVAAFDITNLQDWEVCEWVQLSVASKAYRDGGIYVSSERHIRAFNDWLLDQLATPAGSD